MDCLHLLYFSIFVIFANMVSEALSGPEIREFNLGVPIVCMYILKLYLVLQYDLMVCVLVLV